MDKEPFSTQAQLQYQMYQCNNIHACTLFSSSLNFHENLRLMVFFTNQSIMCVCVYIYIYIYQMIF